MKDRNKLITLGVAIYILFWIINKKFGKEISDLDSKQEKELIQELEKIYIKEGEYID